MHTLEQLGGAIRALQTSIMVIFVKIVSNVNFDFNYSRKEVNLVAWVGPERASADGYIIVLNIQMEISKDEREVKISKDESEVKIGSF